jgi:hypothetical protein
MKIDHILDSFICDLADENLDSIEEEALWEVLQKNPKLFKYTVQVIRGRFLAKKLSSRISSSNYVADIQKRIAKSKINKQAIA